MPNPILPGDSPDEQAFRTEIFRLNKIIRALMDRAEHSTSVQASDFSLFQTAIILEEQVRRRTAELEAALRENEKITRALRESEAKFRGLVSQSLVGIAITQDGRFSYSNAKFDEIFGYSAEEVQELGPLDIATENDRPLVAENMRKRYSGEVERIDYVFRALRKDGTVIDVEIHSSAMEIGGKMALFGLVMDVTERTRAEREVQALQEKLREQSTHDALTGLYNRRYLEETLGRELILAERHGHPVSVIMGDLDHFKAINDCYGHLGGDEVLRVFGDLMKRNSRGSDIYCRYGGEEFLLVMPQMAKENAIERAEQLCATMASAPVCYGESQIAVTASFGVATFPRDGRTGDELIAAADSALYAAKAAGRNRVIVNSGPVGVPS
jgi:diguanylate cyclase (GGDEF)-like protein/PAS domain S-box-containing protein